MFKRLFLAFALLATIFTTLPVRADEPTPITLGLGTLTSMALSPDGKQLVVGTTIGVYYYDAQSFTLTTFQPTEYAINDLVWSSTGQYLLLYYDTPTYSHRFEIKRLSDSTVAFSFTSDDTRGLHHFALSPDETLLAVARNSKIEIYNIVTGALVKRVESNQKYYTHYDGVAFSPDSTQLAVCCVRNQLEIWNAGGWQTQKKLNIIANLITWSPDGRRLAAAVKGDAYLGLWDTTSYKFLQNIPAGEYITSLSFSPDSYKLAVATRLIGIVRVWELGKGAQLLYMLQGHHNKVTDVAWSPDSQTLYSAGDNVIRAWSLETGKLIRSIDGFTERIDRITWSGDGVNLIGLQGHQIGAWNVASHLPIEASRLFSDLQDDIYNYWPDSRSALHFTVSPDNKLFAIATWESIYIHKTDSLSFDRRLFAVGTTSSLVFSPDSKSLLSAGNSPVIWIWNRESGKYYSIGDPVGRYFVASATYNDDGQSIFVLRTDGILEHWDLLTKTLLSTLRVSDHFPLNIATINSSANILAFKLEDQIEISDLQTGQVRFEINAPYYYHLITNPSGTRLAAIYQNSIRLWDLTNGQLLADYQSHTLPVTDLAFSPDGSQLAASSSDGTILIWNVP